MTSMTRGNSMLQEVRPATPLLAPETPHTRWRITHVRCAHTVCHTCNADVHVHVLCVIHVMYMYVHVHVWCARTIRV